MPGFNPHATSSHSCNQCTHYGGWIATMEGDRRAWIYGWCLRHQQVATQPLLGCAHFDQVQPVRTAPVVWTGDPTQAPAGVVKGPHA